MNFYFGKKINEKYLHNNQLQVTFYYKSTINRYIVNIYLAF